MRPFQHIKKYGDPSWNPIYFQLHLLVVLYSDVVTLSLFSEKCAKVIKNNTVHELVIFIWMFSLSLSSNNRVKVIKSIIVHELATHLKELFCAVLLVNKCF